MKIYILCDMEGVSGIRKMEQVMLDNPEYAEGRELMMADMSSKQAYQATVIQQEAASEAASERFFTFRPSVPDGATYKAGWR